MYEDKTVSVKEGESVTLRTGAEIQIDDHLQWMFEPQEKPIAEIKGDTREISYRGADGRFRDRLKLDEKTGSLTITNITTEHIGVYNLQINSSRETLYQRFIVNVKNEDKTESVKEGESVTLMTGAEIQNNDHIQWMFGPQEKPIAEIKGDTREISYRGADGRFRDRLKLDEKTGSLTITNITAEHIGVYNLQINRNKGALYQRFIVTVKNEDKTVSVKEGESVTLMTGAEIQNDDQIQWMFGPQEKPIAEIKGDTREISYHGADGRFRDRLKLDEKTGSLIITDITAEHIGVYNLQTTRNKGALYQRFIVNVKNEDKTESVKEGESVTLRTGAEIQNNDHIQWMFGPQEKPIAEIKGDTREISYRGADGRFRDRLKLDEKTGSLTITNITAEHIGVYNLQINRNKGALYQRFIVNVKHEDKTVSVKEGESVTLKTGAEIQNDDKILWRFGPQEKPIAEIRGETREISTYHSADGRFRDRLKLDKKTGSLIITDTTAEHIGVYNLQTTRNRGALYQRFIVTVKIELISLVEGEPVTLHTNTEMQKDDLIVWMFGDEGTRIAQMTGKKRETFGGTDGRFRDQLKLDKRTGSLTIKSTRTEHSGLYILQISNRETTGEIFKVAINLEKVSAKEGESVSLNTNAVIQRKDDLQWLFGDENTPIAGIKKDWIGKISTFDVGDSRFRGRLQLDEKTGSLIITNITTEHEGVYSLKPVGSKSTEIKRWNVTVRVLKSVEISGRNVTLNTDTEVQRDDLVLWMFGDQDDLIAQLTGETGEMTYGMRFRDKLTLNKNTGSLSISDITSGPYNLRITSSKRTSYRKFRVFKPCESDPKTVSVMAGECLVLITDFNVERDGKVEWRFGDKILITGMNGGGDERFRDRLELHHQTGSLTIKDTRTSDTGVYRLNLCSRGGNNISWECSVTCQ
ncbi:uncharacterized protein LOC120475649 isoform X2 [Pimephales promelas]|nr:uncharacterized protein LOC120475649 isoform X2 [Pimephales promelas]